MNRRVILGLLIVLILVFGSASMQQGLAQGGVTRLRIVHASADLPPIDLYIDEYLAAKNVKAGDSTLHFNLPPGPHNVAVRPAGADPSGAAVMSQTVNIGADLAYSVLILGNSNAPQMVLYDDVLEVLDVGTARFAVINAAPGLDAVDVIRTDGAPLLVNVPYGEISGTIDISAGFYDLLIVPPGGEPGDVIVPVGALDMQTHVMYTLIAIGESSEGGDQVIVLADRVNAVPEPTTLTRFVNVSSMSDGFDVYLDTTLILSDLERGEASISVSLPLGEYELSLRRAGMPPNSEAFFSESISPIGDAQTFGIGGDEGAITLTPLPDIVGGITPESTRLQALNFSDNPASAALDDGTVIAINLPGGTPGEAIDTAPGDYLLTGQTEREVSLFGGTLYSVIFYGDGEVVVSPIHMAVELTSSPFEQPEFVNAPPTLATGPDGVTAPGDVTPAPTQVAAVDPPPAPSPTAVPPTVSVLGDDKVLGVVTLDQGANLQCREYPTSVARSLGLIPNNTELEILSLFAARDETGEEGGRTDALEIDDVPDFMELSEESIAEMTLADLWLDVNWVMPDGVMGCWVNAFYLQMRYRTKQVREVSDILTLVDLNLIRLKPYNIPGGPRDSAGGVAPAPAPSNPPVTDVITATVLLDPSVNLQLRRTPGVDGESLALIPGGSQLTVIEQTEIELGGLVGEPTIPEWLLVEYQAADGTLYRGWVSAQFVALTYKGLPYDLENVPVAEEIEIGGAVSGSGSGAPAAAPSPSPQPAAAAPKVEGRLAVNPDAQLNLRDRPSEDGVVLIGIPGTTVLEVFGRNGDGTWLNVVYNIEGGGRVQGWVAAEFVTLSLDGQTYTVNQLPITTDEADAMGQ